MDNVTAGGAPRWAGPLRHNYAALLLGVVLVLATVLGNVLVCVSVLTQRSLKTATNYFIISLAAADLLLGLLVLPLFVYSEFLGGVWTFSTWVCDALMTMDVLLCTASILNLCAISVDRYIAVVVPLKYNRNQFSVRQLALIAATWALSVGVASPVIFGLNRVPGRDPRVCRLEDGSFVVYSSVCSFFLPCPVMLLLYYCMFRGLRRWSSAGGRSRTVRGARRSLSLRLASARRAPSWEKAAYAAPPGPGPASPGVASAASIGPAQDRPRGAESDPVTTQMDSTSDAGPAAGGGATVGNGPRGGGAKRGRRNSKSSRVSGRERKAMRVLPVVVGVFLACWTPFFVVHVTKVLCASCRIGSALISVVTWLGYVNSAVNPVIYTAFNAEFRNVFHKLLCCKT